MVRGGWVRVHPRPEFRLKGYCQQLKADEDFAKESRYNIWYYGDAPEEEEEDDRRGRKGKGGRR